MIWAGYVAPLGDKRDLMGKPEGNVPSRRPSRWWQNNIDIYLKEIVLDNVNLIHLAQDK